MPVGSSAKNYKELTNQMDHWIREGQTKKVRDTLAELRPKNVPRVLLADFANIARRSGMPELCLTLLRPVVRPERGTRYVASPKETAVYASALTNLGMQTEALRLLEPLRKRDLPEPLLYLGFAYQHQWEYQKAAPVFRRFLTLPSISSYQVAIGKLNLASCYRWIEKDDAVDELLSEVLKAARANGWSAVVRNALEVAAQSAIVRHEWSRAKELLNEAARVSGALQLDALWVRKWQVLQELERRGPTAEVLESLLGLQRDSRETAAWETVRECDFYRSLRWRDAELFHGVYFGTPFIPYRNRMQRMAKDWIELPTTFTWRILGGDGSAGLDLQTGKDFKTANGLKAGQALHRLLQILASDHYRPFRIGEIFARLYPGDFYHPEHSPARVQTNLQRLRRWFEESGVPLDIRHETGAYRLTAKRPYTLLMALGPRSIASASESDQLELLRKLSDHFQNRFFTTQQAADALSIALHQTREILREGLKLKKVHRSGSGRGTLFKFAR